MRSSTLYKLIGSAFLSGAVVGGISTCSSNNDLYHNLGELSQLEERMQEKASPEKYEDLERKEITLSVQASKNNINTVEGFLLTVVSFGAGAYVLGVASRKKEEEFRNRMYRELYQAKDGQ